MIGPTQIHGPRIKEPCFPEESQEFGYLKKYNWIQDTIVATDVY